MGRRKIRALADSFLQRDNRLGIPPGQAVGPAHLEYVEGRRVGVEPHRLLRHPQGVFGPAREVQCLRLPGIAVLALQAEKIIRKPYIPSLEENNTRKGFFEQEEYEAVLAKLPEHLRPVVTFVYCIGWRTRSEVLRLTWSQVDLTVGTVRPEVGDTKNKDGRLIYLTEELHAMFMNQWHEHQTLYPDCPWVFRDHGKQVKTFYKSWRKACLAAQLPGKLGHDFRRTAVRNMVRAGIPERVAMQIAGHKTRSVFDRYHIVADSDLKEAAQRLNRTFSSRTTTISTTIASFPGESQSPQLVQVPTMQ